MQPGLGLSGAWAEVLRRGMTWDPAWHNENESMFSIARKIACANATSHEHVLRLIYFRSDELAVTRQFADGQGDGIHYVSTLLQVEPRRLSDGTLTRLLRPGDKSVVAPGLRYCSACMRRSFHSPLFQLYLLDTCPLHGERLCVECQHCHSRPINGKWGMTSFTLCPRCGLPYFPELDNWLEVFFEGINPEPFRQARNWLETRVAAGYVESAWRHWDLHRDSAVVNVRPALSAIGALLRAGSSRAQAAMELTVRTCEIDQIFSESSIERCARGMISDRLFQQALRVSREPKLIPYRDTRTNEERALELLYDYFGLACGETGASSLRRISTHAVFGTLTTSDGRVITSGNFVNAIVKGVVDGLYREALASVQASKDGNQGREWFELGWQAREPIVWVGTSGGDRSVKISAMSGLDATFT